MSINVFCVRCNATINKKAGLLLSPPDVNEMVKKLHVCGNCYDQICRSFFISDEAYRDWLRKEMQSEAVTKTELPTPKLISFWRWFRTR